MANGVSAAKARSLAMKLKALDLSKFEEGTSCCICQQPLLGPGLYEFPFATPCGHIFRKNCLMKWLTGGDDIKNCPGCRQSILKEMTDEEGEERALLEELDMHGLGIRFQTTSYRGMVGAVSCSVGVQGIGPRKQKSSGRSS